MSRTLASILAVCAAASTAHADARTLSATRAVVQRLPKITLDDHYAQNPQVFQLDASYVIHAGGNVDYICTNFDSNIVPLAQVDLVTPGDWVFAIDAPGVELYLIDNQDCHSELNGKTLQPTRGVLWGVVNKAIPRTVKLDVHLVALPQPVTIDLPDDMSRPVATRVHVQGGIHPYQPLVITSTKRHHIKLSALDLPAGVVDGWFKFGNRHNWDRKEDTMVRPDQPVQMDLLGRAGDPGRDVMVVIEEPGKTVVTEQDIYGAPGDGAALADRELWRYTLAAPPNGGMSRANADFAGRLFTTIDPSFIVYATEAHGLGCHFVAGEPLIVVHRDYILHANGLTESCQFQQAEQMSDIVTAQRPAPVVMPAFKEPGSDETMRLWYDEDFLAQADQDKGIAAYKKAKATASACYDREWSKLDPDGKAYNYDLVSMNQSGQITKVEGYGDRIFRQVSATCGIDNLASQRAAIYKRLAKTFRADELKRLDAIAKRFAGM